MRMREYDRASHPRSNFGQILAGRARKETVSVQTRPSFCGAAGLSPVSHSFQTMTARRLLRVLLGALCLLGSAASHPAQGLAEDESPLRREYFERLASIETGDAGALFELGFEFYGRAAEGADGLTLLEVARDAFLRAKAADPDHPKAGKLAEAAENERIALEKRINPDLWKMLFSVVGGLGIFLIGMRNMSDGIQAVAGNRMRRMIGAITDNRFLAIGVGTGVTCLVQSSSITTVIVVGLVNSSLMQLHQAIGVIMGANIGTTITGWILVLAIGKYGLPILGVSVFVHLFSKRDRLRYLALGAMGLGMIFFGLELMKNGFAPMRDVPMFKEAFAWFVADSYIGTLKCAAVGCLLTFMVQSSSATLGITIGLAATGAIPFQTAAALVLGENIGTTITAWLASIGTTTTAKRAAYAHVAFNLMGVLWITTVFLFYMTLINRFVGWEFGAGPVGLETDHPNYAQIVTFGIAAVHTGFNVTNTLLFVPFVRSFARLLEKVVPDTGVKEVSHLSALDIRLVESPILAIENSRGEIGKMAAGVRKMLDWVCELVASEDPDEELVKKVFHREAIMDSVQQEVIHFLTEILAAETPHSVAIEARQQLRIADEFESISDYASAIVKARLRIGEKGLRLEDTERERLLALHERVSRYVDLVTASFLHPQTRNFSRALSESDAIKHTAKEMRNAHLESLSRERIDPVLSMSFSTMLNGYMKVRAHAKNIAESLETT